MSDVPVPEASAASTGNFDLASFLKEEGTKVERALERALASLEPRLSPSLAPVVRHGLLTAGKRVRPILCVAAYTACGRGREPGCYDLAASLEMIHAYSLMHDDLPCMDDAELRRGRPTPHRVFGVRRATRAAATLIPGAVRQAWHAALALGCPEAVARRVVRLLARAAGAGGMAGGQALDLASEGRALSPAQLNRLHALKTGALFEAAPHIGGTAAGAGTRRCEALERYGRALGLAFQIADDILDATSSAARLGKNPSDEALGKSTYVTLYGLERARGKALDQVSLAKRALRAARIDSRPMEAIADYVVSRRR